MTTLPTYAECAAVPPEKRTALERLMYYVDGFFIVHSDAVKANLRAVIEEERKKRDALAAELERVRALSIWGTSVPVGPSYDRLLELEDENTRLRGALRSYARHTGNCKASHWPAGDCDCGLSAALAKEPTT